MLKMTLQRVLIFSSVILLVAVMLQQCWQNKSPAEKWLYLFGTAARDYAGQVLGPARGPQAPIPEALSNNSIQTFDSYIIFSPKSDPSLVMAFSPKGKPVIQNKDQDWWALGDAWYVQVAKGSQGR